MQKQQVFEKVLVSEMKWCLFTVGPPMFFNVSYPAPPIPSLVTAFGSNYRVPRSAFVKTVEMERM